MRSRWASQRSPDASLDYLGVSLLSACHHGIHRVRRECSRIAEGGLSGGLDRGTWIPVAVEGAYRPTRPSPPPKKPLGGVEPQVRRLWAESRL
jgi:hypothetical protein